MKKLVSVLTAVVLVCTMILATGCTTENDETSDKTVKNDIYEIYQELSAASEDARSVSDISDWIYNWAEKHDMTVDRIGSDNLLITKGETNSYSGVQTTTLQCGISRSDYKQYSQMAAIALATMKDATNHGKIKLLVTANIDKLSSKYLETDNLINLSYAKNTVLCSGSAATREYTMTKRLSKTSTSGDKAYKITISGLEGGMSGDRSRTHPNPTEAIASLINKCQSSGMVIEIAKFTGGGSYDTYPQSASITVVVDKNDSTKFEKRVQNAKADYQDKYVSKESDLNYDLTSVSKPSKVYKSSDASDVLSLMYTMSDGVYATIDGNDNSDPIAVSNLGYLRMTGSKFTAKVSARSLDADETKIMDNEFKATADLNDMSFRKSKTTGLWPYDQNSKLAKSFKTASDEYALGLSASSTFMKNDCAVLYKKKSDLNMIAVYSNIEEGFNISKSLMLFFQNLAD